jgi:hypothetical protein
VVGVEKGIYVEGVVVWAFDKRATRALKIGVTALSIERNVYRL